MRGCACRGTAGFAHVSCLAEQAKILFAEAEENNLGDECVCMRGWGGGTRAACASRTTTASFVCALGWACWKTYVGRPETDSARRICDDVLGNGLSRQITTGRVVRARGRVGYAAAAWRARTTYSLTQAILRPRIDR